MNLGLSSVFPACNFMYSMALMSWRAFNEEGVDFGKAYLDLWESEWMRKSVPTHGVAMWHYFIFAILQIILYPLLAVLAERLVHGISYARREFHDDDTAKAASASIQTSELRKVYSPSIWTKMFCCGARRGAVVTALDGIDLTAQKQQIMCLLGVNGSGKTTTLELIGGMQKSTAGSVQINSNYTKLGMFFFSFFSLSLFFPGYLCSCRSDDQFTNSKIRRLPPEEHALPFPHCPRARQDLEQD